jgi:4-amino-4-deoxy-L-arabinose transferase-like glycosyltransferase
MRGAQRLPRFALLMLCAAYILPGLFGRDPWRHADLNAFGFMASIAQGHAPWWQPAIGGVAAEGGPLPYWIGAIAIKALPFFDAAFAARLPFAIILMLTLVLVWYSCFHLACTEAAQPVAFAFGGEAHAIDYARALADGALLAMMATLGLLQLGHETTPELLQLLATSLFLYGLAAAPFRPIKARWAALVSLPVLAASGAPIVAMVFSATGAWLCSRSRYAEAQSLVKWLFVAGLLSALSAWEFEAWAWRFNLAVPELGWRTLNLLAWFTWPAGPLAVWTVWRWRTHWQRRHVLLPLICAVIPITTSILMGGSDRALLLALPAMALLAAFALPILKRGFAAAMDWFSVFFFSASALFFWAYYSSMHLGWPATPLANMRKLAKGFEPRFSALALFVAALATLAWVGLVRWRTAKNQHALWKSLVLPAGGVALGWLLAMTLLLPPLDYARSNSPLVAQLRAFIPDDADCIATHEQALSTSAALEFQGHWRVDANQAISASSCSYALQASSKAAPIGWTKIATVSRPTDRATGFSVLKRQ